MKAPQKLYIPSAMKMPMLRNKKRDFCALAYFDPKLHFEAKNHNCFTFRSFHFLVQKFKLCYHSTWDK